MVGGTRRLDTEVMRAGKGRVLVKGGAEGYYGLGLLSLGLGVALKLEDGDAGRGRNAVVVEVLRQLGALDEEGLAALGRFAAGPFKNHRGLVVGQVRPRFQLTH
jgi:L-asparaginase II